MVKIFVEGGGAGAAATERRKGFDDLLNAAGFQAKPKIALCGTRRQAFDKFRDAMSNPTAGMFYILLVDSEGPVKSPKKPWEYLRKRDKWVRPPDATDDHVHLMIECMEAWLLSDPECLRRRFGKDYNARKLPGNPHPESISKEEIQEALAAVTSGKFHKSEHSFELLATVRPSALIAKCPSAQRFFKVLESHCGRPRAY